MVNTIYRWLMLALLLCASNTNAQETPLATARTNSQILANTQAPAADREALAALFHPGAAALPPFPDDWQIGAVTTFYITDSSDQQLNLLTAELLAIGDNVYVWVETGALVHPEVAATFATLFDTHIYTPVIDLWQIPPSPGRIHVLFSYHLPDNIGGYFLNRDTLRAIVQQPDLLVLNLSAALTLDNPYILSIVAHELQHLLRYQQQPTTESWLDEGFSRFTEYYLGLFTSQFFSQGFAANPDTPLTLWDKAPDKRAHYGANELFMLYFYQQFGDAGLQSLSAISGGNYAAVNQVIHSFTETDFVTFFADWVLANRIQQIEYGYGYTGLVNDADLPPIAATSVPPLPATYTRQLPQFATDYFEITPVGDNLTLTLDFAPIVPILPGQNQAETHFWYSRLADNVHAALTCELDLSGVQSANLTYDVWFDLEDFWDYGYVFVSDNAGQTWTPLITQHGTDKNPFARAYGWGYSGASGDWQTEKISLVDYAGKKIRVQFAVITDDATLQPGMALDNIVIPEIDFTNTGDTLSQNCTAAGWAQVTNALPQKVIVLVVQHFDGDIRTNRWMMPQAGSLTIDILPNAEKITLVITPVTPYTTTPLEYSLHIE